MKYTRILLLISFICLITQLSLKAVDRKTDRKERISFIGRTFHATAGVVKTGLSLAQLATAYLACACVYGFSKQLTNPDRSETDKRWIVLLMTSFSCIAVPTLLGATWDTGKSAIQSFGKAFGRTKKSDSESD